MDFTVAYLAEQLEVVGDDSVPLPGFSVADRARADDLTFAEQDGRMRELKKQVAALAIRLG